MFYTVRSRLITIGILLVLSIWALIPTNTTQRVRDAATGRMKDTTVRRVPINLGLDLQGGIHLALEVDQSKGPVPDPADAIRRAERVVRTRIDEFGVTEPVVQVVGNNRLIVELAGEKDPARAKGVIQRTAFLEFRITDMKNLSRAARSYRALYAVEDRPIITGEELQDARATRDQLTNQSVVNFTLSRRGGRIFDRDTARHVQDYMAIILDGRVQGQPPVIKGQIGQHGQIELGSKPLQEAQDLALVLKAGALPAPLTIIEERTIGPSLGKDSIND